MTRYYTLKNGTRISAFVWDDFAEGDTWRKNIEVTSIDKNGYYTGKETKHPVHKDMESGEVFFNYDGERFFVNKYDYMSLETLIDKIKDGISKNDRWLVKDDEMLATFMMEADRVGFVLDMPVYDTLIPCMGIGLTGDKTMKTLTFPRKDGRYPISNWGYKMTLEASDESLSGYVASDTFYFSDLCSLIKSGHIEIVEKEKYKPDAANWRNGSNHSVFVLNM